MSSQAQLIALGCVPFWGMTEKDQIAYPVESPQCGTHPNCIILRTTNGTKEQRAFRCSFPIGPKLGAISRQLDSTGEFNDSNECSGGQQVFPGSRQSASNLE
jgi:hypothetical protein